jgi:imidazolonepropionase-like amidohydrolase
MDFYFTQLKRIIRNMTASIPTPARWILTASLSLTLAATATAQHTNSPLTVLTNMRLIDGSGAPPRDHVTLVLVDGKIQKICDDTKPCGGPTAGANADLAGKTVMPSLISAHSHLALLNAEGNFDSAQYTEENVIKQLEQYERYGVTTIVSLGMNKDIIFDLREKQKKGEVDGANILTVGRGIGVPNGFPPMGAGDNQLYRPKDAAEARRDVDETADHHADLIKIWIDENHGKFPEMSDDIARAIISEAHKRGLRVAAHVYKLEDARRIVNEGVDILAHSVRDRDVDDSFIALLKSKGTWYLPTLTVDESFFLYADRSEFMQSDFFRDSVPAETYARLTSDAYRNKVLSDKDTQQHRQDFAIATRNLKRLYDAGVNVGFGTDSGAVLGRIPGFSEHRELLLMVNAGLTPLQAIACATSHNAAEMHLSDRGTLKPGMSADLLVVDGDPSKNITDTSHIAAVFHHGHRVEHIKSAK